MMHGREPPQGRDVTGSVEIEIAATADREVVDALARFLPQLLPSATAPDIEHVREIVAAPSTTLLLARDRAQGRRIVGTLTLVIFTIPTGVRAWIEDVVVDAPSRERGVGEALCREALHIAATRGARTVDLTSRSTREAANRLYQRLGFQLRETSLYRCDLEDGSAG
jgi:ribosomal protein S18 acetylase RimI-like enzyme